MDDLSAEKTRELEADLEALRAELRAFLDASADASRPVSLDEPIGRLSRMDALQQQGMARANRTAAEQRLQRTEGALRRIAQGGYGTCLRCEEPVGFARLKVQPDAPFCLACQGRRESGT